MQEISLLRTVLVPVLTPAWKCLLVSKDMFHQCPPAPLPWELSTCKNRVFSTKTKVPNGKGGKQNLHFSLCFSRCQKKVTGEQSGSPDPACIATNSPKCCTRQHLAVQQMVCPRWVWIFFMQKVLFKSKVLTCWSRQAMLGMLQVQLQTCFSSETKH